MSNFETALRTHSVSITIYFTGYQDELFELYSFFHILIIYICNFFDYLKLLFETFGNFRKI